MNSAGRFINIKSVPQTMLSMLEKDVLPASRLTDGQKETLKAQLRSILSPLSAKKCSETDIENIFDQAYHVTNQALHPEKNFRITPEK